MYIDGVQVSGQTVSGSLSAWGTSFRLALANEIGGSRPWRGDLYLVALYGRDLTSTEVKQKTSWPDRRRTARRTVPSTPGIRARRG